MRKKRMYLSSSLTAITLFEIERRQGKERQNEEQKERREKKLSRNNTFITDVLDRSFNVKILYKSNECETDDDDDVVVHIDDDDSDIDDIDDDDDEEEEGKKEL